MNTDFYQEHKPVLLNEVITLLNPGPGKRYIDATVGGGGHTCAILSYGGEVLGIDQDPRSLEIAQRRLFSRFAEASARRACPGVFALQLSNFSEIAKIATSNGFSSVDGILFDLGFASFQIDDPSRGLSFSKDGPLDMRLDPSLGVTATDLVNSLPEKELTRLFWEYGDEPNARPIAKKIVEARKLRLIATTQELVEVVLGKSGKWGKYRKRIHPATKVFQALRIAVNSELENLKTGLNDALKLLKPEGRIAVITFHSGEDKIVKGMFKEWERQGKVRIITKKPIVPGEREIIENPRARSSKLRVVERIYNDQEPIYKV